MVHLAGREPKDNLHFVATNLRRVPQRVYEAVHCQRAHIENHIKELRYGLAIDRTSCTSFWANQLLVPPSRKMGQAIRNHFDARDMDEKHVRERFGVSSANLPTYLALVGNSTRGIAGVQPIGAKMTAKLVEGYGNLENILAAAAELPGSTQHATRIG